MANPVELSLDRLRSLTEEELFEFADSIGLPELANEDGTVNEEIFRQEKIAKQVGSFVWTDVFASAMVKLFSNE